MIAIVDSIPPHSIHELHAPFATVILPRVKSHAAFVFRNRVAEDRTELVADALALAWKWFVRLVKRGKDPCEFPTALATLVCRAVRSGRRITPIEGARDVMSERAQRRHNYRVERLPPTCSSQDDRYGAVGGQRSQDGWEEVLHDNVKTPVPEQANFRLSFPRFMACQTDRNRRIAEFLAMGNSGKAAAQRFGLSPCRISQIRKQLCREWHGMHDDRTPFQRSEADAR